MRETNSGVVVVVDGGGRASALAGAYANSPDVEMIIAVPGNDLIGESTQGKPVQLFPELKTTDISEIIDLVERRSAALVDVAQENAVEVGLVDELIRRGIPVVGPTKDSGRIEWDKGWARRFGKEIGLPQPDFVVCEDREEGLNYLDKSSDKSWFVKARVLATGKGALPALNNEEARIRIDEVIKYGPSFILEEWLKNDDGSEGKEFSAFIISDGVNFQSIGNAVDHKRVFDGDNGPNTGGMGVVSPVEVIAPDLMARINEEIFDKVIKGLRDRKIPYTGVLYLGGMLVIRGGLFKPYVVEFNARHGDPESENLLLGITNDFYEIGQAIAKRDISGIQIVRDSLARVTVAGVSRGYPDNYSDVIGAEIFGLDEAREIARLHGAAVRALDNRYFANGGRLFYLTGEGDSIFVAADLAYSAMNRVSIPGDRLQYRKDIGRKRNYFERST